MKKITSVLALAMAVASLPVTAFAADNSNPVAKNGEPLKYNTPYYLKDKNLPHRGGVTFEPWVLDNFVRFADSPTNNGTSIIFENKDNTEGVIQSGDEIRVKSTKVDSTSQYWTIDTLLNSVYLNYDTTTDFKIYGSSNDNSIGIGIHVAYANPNMGDVLLGGVPVEAFKGYYGEDTEKAWMKCDVSVYKELKDIKTPFEISE
ncbi:hypothetical protein BT246_63870 (plasmid) [Bacillus thuringiensis]|uniref:Uncharacterized protein n=1 Tax=Bacillus thuringiensis TaxID=1428 RepID=A0A9W3SHY8_BACTU|nr:hypothetical protein [Bacillus thuringiensis]ANS51679.1 hypothetical protein BT246_63870 [Bacillus thuringiensis]